jgi:hypothetical protein
MLLLRWIFRSLFLGLITRGLARFFPILRRLIRILLP